MRLRTAVIGVVLGLGPIAGHAPAGEPGAKGEAGEGEARPPVFSQLSFDDALAKTKAEGNAGKVAVVKFTASWCGPCKMMDRTTWRDPKVEAWVKDHGWAIQVDVDEQREVSQAQRVRAMPTMIVYKGGEPVGRRVGYMDATALLRFLDESLADKPAEAAGAAGAPDPALDKMDMQERLSNARQLMEDGELEKATAEYAWLWKNMTDREPAMRGVRVSFMAAEMERLADEHAPAKKVFTESRDALEARLKTEDKTFDDLLDWIVLNRVVGDQDRTLAWFDRVKRDPDVGETFQRVGYMVDDLLEKRGRWADLALLTPDAAGELARAQQMRRLPAKPGMNAEMRKEMEGVHARMFRDKAAVLYVAMLAGGRDEDAAKVAAAAIKAEDTPEMRLALVNKAVEAKMLRRAQLGLLDEAAAKGGDAAELKARVQAGLAAAGG
jgi:thioredoxin 1